MLSKKLAVRVITVASLFSAVGAGAGTLNLTITPDPRTGQVVDTGWVITYPDATQAHPSSITLSFLGISTDSSHTISLEKFADFVGTMDPLVLTFTRVHASTYSEFKFEDETVFNDSGGTWSQFTFGIAGAGVFDSARTPSSFFSAPFATATYSGGDHQIIATGGTLQSGGFPNNQWTPGYDPDASALYFTGTDTFTLAEGPVVPEPASLALLAPGGILLARHRRR